MPLRALRIRDWWLILQCDDEIDRYLRHLCSPESPAAGKISEPLWGTHISVVQNERPPNLAAWNDREGREVSICYEQEPQEEQGYLFMPVQCQEALDYRELLGLPRQPQWPLHLTIGNRKNP